MSGKRSTGVNVGGSSILVIFILLCLTTFATLSMVSANADLKLTEKAASATQEYYAADAQAERTLAVIHSISEQCRKENPETNNFLAACRNRIPERFKEDVSVKETAGNTLLIRYTTPMGDTHQLAVELKLIPTAQGFQLARNTWQVQSVTDWQPGSEGLDLWSGELWLGDGLPPV